MANAATETKPDAPPTGAEAIRLAAEEWKMPRGVGLSSKVLFSPDPTQMNQPESRRRYMGFITKMGPRCVDVLCLVPGGLRPYETVRHVDDPLLVLNPQWLEEDDTGVFRLADSEVLLQKLQATVDVLQASIANLLADKGKSKGS